MSSTRSIIAPPPFAEDALTVIPPTPVAGVSYRDPTAGPASSPDGWPYAERVNSAEWNQIMYQLSSLISIMDKQGVLGWSDSVDYTAAALAFGSDGQLYLWTSPSGPANGGAKDPVSTTGFWIKMLSTAGHGQCRLSVASTTSLELKPYNGSSVIVNGISLQLPAAGVSVSNSGLSASTLYYVYLGGTTASPTLSLSTTGHSTASNGVETKTGDITLTLVGMIFTNSSTQFVDSAASRTCLNWFNRKKLIADVPVAGPFSFTNTTLAETSTTIRTQFLTWADDTPVAQMSAQFTQTSGTPAVTQLNFQIFMDGTSTAYGPAVAHVVQPTWNVSIASHGALGGLAEGYHFATLGTYVGVNGGTLSVNNVQTSVNIFG